MKEEIVLQAVPRTVTGKKVNQIRREKWVPMVVYGPGFEPEIYQARHSEFDRVLSLAGMTTLVSLQVEGQKGPYSVLVRDIQRDVLTDALVHVDLYRVSMTQKISTEDPVEFVGEQPPLVISGEAMTLTLLSHVEIECLPGDLVSSLELDLSSLQSMEDVLQVSDLSVPENITILTAADEVLVRLTHATRIQEDEEEELEVETEIGEVEVITKGKTEEEE